MVLMMNRDGFGSLIDVIQNWRSSWQQEADTNEPDDSEAGDNSQSSDDRIVIGTRDDDILVGGDNDQVIFALNGDDEADGAGGNDWIAGWFGNDTLDGGPGSDKVFGGWGDDHFHYDTIENEGSRDYYNGGAGHDTLKLHVSQGIYEDEAFQEDLAAFGEQSSSWQSTRPFHFEKIGLTIHRIEDIEVYVDGELIENAIPTDESEPNEVSGMLEQLAAWLPPAFMSQFDQFAAASDNGSWLN